MNAYWVLAFVVTPAMVFWISYIGLIYSERSIYKGRQSLRANNRLRQ